MMSAQRSPSQRLSISELYESWPLRLLYTYLGKHITVSQTYLNEIKQLPEHQKLIYVFPVTDLFDQALLRATCFNHGLLQPRFHLRPLEQNFSPIFSKHQVLSIDLKKGSSRDAPGHAYQTLFQNVLEHIRQQGIRLRIVPVYFDWSRRPGELKPRLFETFKPPHAQVRLYARLLKVLVRRDPITLHVGAPIDVSLSESGDLSHAKRLRRKLSLYFQKERYVMTGPPLQSGKRVIRSILKDQALQSDLRAYAERRATSVKALEAKVKRDLREIISLYHPAYVEYAYALFSRLESQLFSKIAISPDAVEMIKRASHHGALLLLPNHRSHLDYLAISYLFYKNKLSLPRIAAGINLSFFPAGFFFRRCGAYFIRRSLTKDPIYTRTLRAYVRWLVHHDNTQEFFIEGGRTRTGRILYPKLGLLTFHIESFLKHPGRDIIILPISMMYDWVPERESLSRECFGAPKQKENARTLLGLPRIFKRNHGEMRLEVGAPISLRDFFRQELEDGSTVASKPKVRALGQLTLSRIADASKATSHQLAGLCALSFDAPFQYVEFEQRFNDLTRCLPADRYIEQEQGLLSFWRRGLSERWLIEHQEGYFSLAKAARPLLDYQRQAISHIFAELALGFCPPEIAIILEREFPMIRARQVAGITDVAEKQELILSLFYTLIDIHRLAQELGSDADLETLSAKLAKRYPEKPELLNQLLLQNTLDLQRRLTPTGWEQTLDPSLEQRPLQKT